MRSCASHLNPCAKAGRCYEQVHQISPLMHANDQMTEEQALAMTDGNAACHIESLEGEGACMLGSAAREDNAQALQQACAGTHGVILIAAPQEDCAGPLTATADRECISSAAQRCPDTATSEAAAHRWS